MKDYNDYVGLTKRYLKSYNQLKITAMNLTEEIAAQQAMLNGESVAIAKYGNELGGGAPELYATERAADNRIKCEQKIAALTANKAHFERILSKMDRAMDGLNPVDRELVRGHYIDGYNWQQVAQRVYYSEKWAREKGGKALQKMALMMFGAVAMPHQLQIVFGE